MDLTAAKSTITNQFCTLHNLRGKRDPLINAPWFRWQALPTKWDNGSKICFIFKQRDGWQLLPTEIACKLAPVSDENPSPQLESGVATGSGYVSICCSQTYKHGERGTKKEYQQKAGSTFSLPTLAVGDGQVKGSPPSQYVKSHRQPQLACAQPCAGRTLARWLLLIWI